MKLSGVRALLVCLEVAALMTCMQVAANGLPTPVASSSGTSKEQGQKPGVTVVSSSGLSGDASESEQKFQSALLASPAIQRVVSAMSAVPMLSRTVDLIQSKKFAELLQDFVKESEKESQQQGSDQFKNNMTTSTGAAHGTGTGINGGLVNQPKAAQTKETSEGKGHANRTLSHDHAHVYTHKAMAAIISRLINSNDTSISHGPFTIFAPSNAAWENDKGELAQLMAEISKDKNKNQTSSAAGSGRINGTRKASGTEEEGKTLPIKTQARMVATLLYHIVPLNLSIDRLVQIQFPATLVNDTEFVHRVPMQARAHAERQHQMKEQQQPAAQDIGSFNQSFVNATASDNSTTNMSVNNSQVLHLHKEAIGAAFRTFVEFGLEPAPALPMPFIAQIIKPNVEFDGGIIHVIDRVLQLPKLVSEVALSANQSKFVAALNQSGILEKVDKSASITVFLPTDEGLAGIDWTQLQAKPQNESKSPASASASASAPANEGSAQGQESSSLIKVLLSQVVVGIKYSTGFTSNMELRTLANTTINITLNNGTGQWQIGNSTLLINDVVVNNGVLHLVDALFFAQNLTVQNRTQPQAQTGSQIGGAGKNASSQAQSQSAACMAKNCTSPSLCCDVSVNDVLNASAICYDPGHFVCAKRGNFLCGASAPLVCGDQCYTDSQYRCFGSTLLCPVTTLLCGVACYDPNAYSCTGDQLAQLEAKSSTAVAGSASLSPASSSSTGSKEKAK